MRALLLLLVVVLAFAAVRWFRLTAGAPADPSNASETQAHFLAPPPVSAAEPAAPVPASKSSVTVAEPAEAPVQAGETRSWPSDLASGLGPAEEVQLAAALVHGTPAEVQEVAKTQPKDRALLLEAFAWVLAGERQLALSLSTKIASKSSLEGREVSLFESALTGRAAASSASAGSAPVPLAMEMALLAKEAKTALEGRHYPEAAREYSALLIGELGAPWAPDRGALTEWTAGLSAAQREHRWSPRGEWPAVEVPVQAGDTLIAIRLRYLADRPGARMCTGLIERANRIKGYLQPGQLLKVPTDAVRVLVDLEARWALFFLGDEVAAAWPVGIGRSGEETPVGDYTVRNKLENPPWMKEGQEPIPFGDPRNPLGTRWIGWSKDGAKTSYGFHGTWEPESIGHAASDGCVRLLNGDVEELFQILPEGAPLRIQG